MKSCSNLMFIIQFVHKKINKFLRLSGFLVAFIFSLTEQKSHIAFDFLQHQIGQEEESKYNSSFQWLQGRAVKLNVKPSGLSLNSTLFPPLTCDFP